MQLYTRFAPTLSTFTQPSIQNCAPNQILKYIISSSVYLCNVAIHLPSHSLHNLQQVFAVQVPLLDAVVSRAAEENVPLDHQRLNTVVMGRFKVVCWADAPQRAFSHIEQLQEPQRCM